jgi:uncharacterized protein (TIGR02271 family)
MTANIQDQQAHAKISDQQAQKTQRGLTDEEWVDRREERLQVGKESVETGHVKLHRYVDAEPVEKTVHLSHEEYDVERMPVSANEPIRGTVAELEQEITLHGERAVMHSETVPVERVRLLTKNVEEDKTYRDEIRRERIEVEPDQLQASNGQRQSKPRPRKRPGVHALAATSGPPERALASGGRCRPGQGPAS